MNPSERRYRIARPEVASELLDGEYVLIHFESGSYYSARGTAAETLALLEAGATAGQACAALAARYGEPEREVAETVAPFIEHLASERLLAEIPAEAAPAFAPAPQTPAAAPFEPPSLEVFTDMQDLLLLDPIHDVDQAGWPLQRPEAA